MNSLPPLRIKKERTTLSLSDAQRQPAEAGSVSKATINNLDYHNEVAEWIGTPRRIHQKPGAAFGKPTNATSSAVYWRDKVGKFWQRRSDTQPKRKSLDAARAGTPPNPGRPELGGMVRDQ